MREQLQLLHTWCRSAFVGRGRGTGGPGNAIVKRYPLVPQEAPGRGGNNVVEQHGAVDEQGEADDLQPFEGFPAEAQADDPDEQRAARVDGAARGGRDGAGDGEAEEVEAAGHHHS